MDTDTLEMVEVDRGGRERERGSKGKARVMELEDIEKKVTGDNERIFPATRGHLNVFNIDRRERMRMIRFEVGGGGSQVNCKELKTTNQTERGDNTSR